MIKLSSLKPLSNNPRTITISEEKKLRESLERNDWMLEIREIVVDENNIIIGGNQRYRQLIEMGYDVIPDEWVKKVTDLTEEQKRMFIILDNRNNGVYDIDVILSDYKKEMEVIDKLFIDNTNYKFDEEQDEEEPTPQPKVKDDWFVTINCSNEEHAKQILEEVKQSGEVAFIHN